jgi:hypothetical protein
VLLCLLVSQAAMNGAGSTVGTAVGSGVAVAGGSVGVGVGAGAQAAAIIVKTTPIAIIFQIVFITFSLELNF